MQPEERLRPRWLFRGRPGAWDALTSAIATDPSRPARWPIAPSGPSMADGDVVLLWRSGRGGGIAALCTVVGEPEAQPRPHAPPEVVVGLRIERAFGHPIAPSTLATDPVLRPLAFMDLLDTTEHRVTPLQEEALASLLEDREHLDPGDDPDGVRDDSRTTVAVPLRLAPLVEELLVALGADEAPPAQLRAASSGPRDPASGTTSIPPGTSASASAAASSGDATELQVEQAEQLARRHGSGTFTVDDAASVWRTGVGTARSRVERLLESGLMERAGVLRSEERPGVRPTRGRPPVLYRLAAGRPPAR
jgi:hypothetical protein